jgi:hypothetical protein
MNLDLFMSTRAGFGTIVGVSRTDSRTSPQSIRFEDAKHASEEDGPHHRFWENGADVACYDSRILSCGHIIPNYKDQRHL